MKVTKKMLVAEAKRVFGEGASVVVDNRPLSRIGFWECGVLINKGVTITAASDGLSLARRRLYDALCALQRKGSEVG